MKADNEMHFVDNTNYQSLETAPPQNLTSVQNLPPVVVPNYVPVPNFVPSDSPISSRLIGTKMVRIRFETKCADCSCNKPFFKINTIDKIDDLNPASENESPLLEAEMFIPCWCPVPIRFDFIDAQTRQPFSVSQYKEFGRNVVSCCGCCGENYFIFPDMLHYKHSNINDISVIQCYDSRSFYRTFSYNGTMLYQIGEPYVPMDDCCKNCCACCKNPVKIKDEPCCNDCCSCCKTVQIDKRTYVDIFNMSNQCVGKYVKFFEVTGCTCCQTPTLFFEIYFPSDANEMLKLALIGQLIFLLQVGPDIFGVLPGTSGNPNLYPS